MSAEADFRALLAAHGPLAAVVGSAISQNGVPPNAVPPYVSFTAEHQREHTLQGELVDDTVTFTTICWARSAAEADQVADLVEQAIASAPAANLAIVLSRGTAFDPDLNLDATVLIVEWTATL